MSKFIKILFVFIVLGQVSVLKAQDMTISRPEMNVPNIVVEKFNQKFPTHNPVWFSQYNGRYNQKLVYEGRFIFDNRYSSAVYDNDGNLIAFASIVEKSELPENVVQYMEEKFPSFIIADALLVTRGINDVTYELGIYIDNQYVIKVFTKDGKFIKSTRA